MNYQEYIDSNHWKQLRVRKFAQVGRNCEACRSGRKLNVHHCFYRNFTDCTLDDLMVLCERCHGFYHKEVERMGIPMQQPRHTVLNVIQLLGLGNGSSHQPKKRQKNEIKVVRKANRPAKTSKSTRAERKVINRILSQFQAHQNMQTAIAVRDGINDWIAKHEAMALATHLVSAGPIDITESLKNFPAAPREPEYSEADYVKGPF